MPLPASYNGTGQAWPVTIRNVKEATNPALTPTLTPSLLVRQNFTNPVAADPDGFIDDVLGPDAAGTVTYEPGDVGWGILTGNLDFARNVIAVVTHASSVVAMTILVTGLDQYGRTITETLAITATGTSKTATGVKAFKSVTSIAVTVAADASANTMNIGTGKTFGLAFKSVLASLVKELAIGSIVTNGVVVAASDVSSADLRGTYTPNGTPDGSNDWSVWYIVDDPINV